MDSTSCRSWTLICSILLCSLLLSNFMEVGAKSLDLTDGADTFVAVSIGDGAIETPVVEEEEDSEANTNSVSSSAPSSKFGGKECNIYQNEPLHAIMDRVCELCHDFYSHQMPNMRSECRSDCFRSENFKKCLRLFKPSKSLRRQNRTRM